jgi:GxxExxY protein
MVRHGLRVEAEKRMPVVYDGIELECGYRIDLLVEDAVVVELKAVEKLEPVHTAQLLTYLKLSGHSIGLILNFNVRLLRDGIRRVVLGLRE